MFFDKLHPVGVVQQLLAEKYKHRWAKANAHITRGGEKDILTPATWVEMGRVGCKHLRWLGKVVPSRVHLANIRFHCDGWHTAARYQRRVGSQCVFCQQTQSEDSINHILRCPIIQDLFPESLKRGHLADF